MGPKLDKKRYTSAPVRTIPASTTMELDFEATLSAPLSAVEAALLDPALVPALAEASTVLAEASLVTRLDEGGTVRREAFYVLAPGAWPGLSRRVLPRVAWTERVVWDRRSHEGTFVVVPEVPAPLERRVRCAGGYSLREVFPGTTARRVSGSLTIDAPFVGARAEALLLGILARFFDEEARLVEARAGRL